MKKILLIFGALITLAVVLLVCTSSSGLHVGGLGLGYSEDKSYVEHSTMSFLEDIKYKDFKKAAVYHRMDERKTVDIPGLIERIFVVKPEFCDFLRYQVTGVDIDSTGTRARVHTKCVIKVLNTSEIKEPETIFYWYKDPKEGWCMKLESSLH